MTAEKCAGSDRWGAGENVLGRGRCAHCQQLIRCNNSGILSPHKQPEVRTP